MKGSRRREGNHRERLARSLSLNPTFHLYYMDFRLVSAQDIAQAYALEVASFPADEAASLDALQSAPPSATLTSRSS